MPNFKKSVERSSNLALIALIGLAWATAKWPEHTVYFILSGLIVSGVLGLFCFWILPNRYSESTELADHTSPNAQLQDMIAPSVTQDDSRFDIPIFLKDIDIDASGEKKSYELMAESVREVRESFDKFEKAWKAIYVNPAIRSKTWTVVDSDSPHYSPGMIWYVGHKSYGGTTNDVEMTTGKGWSDGPENVKQFQH